MLGFLNSYVREHFSREESIMRIVSCPAAGQNCTAHQALIRKLDAWVARLNAEGATTALVLEVNREASAWLQQHILSVDCQLRSRLFA
jgi:hemerythrin-like metal-binding protein